MGKINYKAGFYFLGILILLLSACSNSEKYNVEIKKLDSVKILLDSAAIKFACIDVGKINRYVSEINNNLDLVDALNKDTLKSEQAFLLSEYRSSRKPLKVIIAKYTTVADELPKSKKQIENLIHDFKIGKIDETEAKVYVQDEMIVAGSVIHATNIMENLDRMYSEKHTINTPKVLDFVNGLKTEVTDK